MSKTVKPLPCPFCGRDAKCRRWSYDPWGTSWDCGCANNSCHVRPNAMKLDTRAAAIAAWNRRAK